MVAQYPRTKARSILQWEEGASERLKLCLLGVGSLDLTDIYLQLGYDLLGTIYFWSGNLTNCKPGMIVS